MCVCMSLSRGECNVRRRGTWGGANRSLSTNHGSLGHRLKAKRGRHAEADVEVALGCGADMAGLLEHEVEPPTQEIISGVPCGNEQEQRLSGHVWTRPTQCSARPSASCWRDATVSEPAPHVSEPARDQARRRRPFRADEVTCVFHAQRLGKERPPLATG